MSGTEIKLALSAFFLELGAIALLFMYSNETAVLYGYLFMHAGASALISPVAWMFMPAQYRQPRAMVLLLLFSLCFFIPVIGIVGFFIGIVLAYWMPVLGKANNFLSVLNPHYEIDKKSIETNRLRIGQVRTQLVNKDMPLELRMKALLTMQNVSARHASGLLHDALADSVDDLRLLAYGMLDSQEKKITLRIHEASEALKITSEPKAIYAANKQLAELYWELVYQNLVQGDMKLYALEQVKKYAMGALQLQRQDAGLWMLFGRMQTLAGNYEGALDAFSAAISKGMPSGRVQPYFAEVAYLQKDFAAVREYMEEIKHESRNHAMTLATGFWVAP